MGEAPRTWGERVSQRRRARLVGRDAELTLLVDLVTAEDPPHAVVAVVAPGGVGKTTLLAALADDLRAGDVGVTEIEAQRLMLEPPPRAPGRHVYLVDEAEKAAGLEEWLRESFLPGLPADHVLVLAGRTGPSPGWVADPGWAGLVRTLSLRNLEREPALAMLTRSGVPAAVHGRVIDATHGHPLSLALVADLLAQQPEVVDFNLLDAPSVVQVLVGSLLDAVPSDRHRRAIHVAAHAQYLTEALLADVVGAEGAGDLFAWVGGLSFVSESPRGLMVHDLVRDVLEADLRWRDPAAYARQHLDVKRHVARRVERANGDEALRLAGELHFLQRSSGRTDLFYDWDLMGVVLAAEPREDDLEEIRAAVRRWQGAEQAQILDAWLGTDALSLLAFRHGEKLVGFAGHLHLHLATAEQIAADPGARAVWEHVERFAPLRPGDRCVAGRFFLDVEQYQGASASNNAITTWHVWHCLNECADTYDFVAAYEDGDTYEVMLANAGYRRLRDAEYAVGERTYATFGFDFRRTGPAEWYRSHNLGFLAEVPDPSGPEDEVAVLSAPDFAAAVRRALRDLKRPDALATNPLRTSRLAVGTSLPALIEGAMATIAEEPRGERLARVLDRTFLRPAGTQEAAAEVLGLPWGTYRRHLAKAEERLVALLWQAELYGDS